jgi:hypothetical protein
MKAHATLGSPNRLGASSGTPLNVEQYTGVAKSAPKPKTNPVTGQHPVWVEQSPWLDDTKPNLFAYEFQLAKENLPHAEYKPIAIYDWIHRHGGERLFFKGLARWAPIFPVIAYHDQVAVWTSPPPSGFGNAIFMVMGHDSAGQLRLVGGNYFTEPSRKAGSPARGPKFFAQYDSADDHLKQQLVRDAVSLSISPKDKRLLYHVRQECEHFHTMAIYITVLTNKGSLFHAAKAVIEGNKPADFSYEYFGEIK